MQAAVSDHEDDRLFPVRDVADHFIEDILVGNKFEMAEDLLEKHD